MIPKKPVVILFSGKAGVGKTTACNELENIIEKQFPKFLATKTFHFAHGVKKSASNGFEWDGDKDDKGRKLLQQVGQVGREYNKNIWARQCASQISDEILDFNLIAALIDDWRFPNEFLYMMKSNWNIFTVKINAERREILKGLPEYHDVSETSLPREPAYYDFILNNSYDDENKKYLKLQLNDIMSKISEEINYFGEEE